MTKRDRAQIVENAINEYLAAKRSENANAIKTAAHHALLLKMLKTLWLSPQHPRKNDHPAPAERLVLNFLLPMNKNILK